MLFPVLREWLGQGSRPVPASSRALSDSWYGFGAPPLQMTWGDNKADPIANEFSDYVEGGLKANGIVYSIERIRCGVFAEARFQFQELKNGRPGDLFGTQALSILERPWEGGTTGDLLSGMLLDADMAGNAFRVRVGDEIVRLRPDWVEIVIAPVGVENAEYDTVALGYRKVGYLYWHGGKHSGSSEPVMLPLDQVAHFAPMPDPNAYGRGMSWMTPVIREIQADKQGTVHKSMMFENGATPNLHIGLEKMSQENFAKWVDIFENNHAGAANAYKTLYTAGGTDVTPLGSNMQQLDYKAIIGAGETRLAAAGGVHPVVLGLSEGMQGSSLNAGNYVAAKRNFVDGTMRQLWRNVCGSLEVLVPAPSIPGGTSQLWYDDRDIAFLREDTQDRANIAQTLAVTIRNLVDAGYEPQSVVDAVKAEDMSRLVHSGLFSVQLQAAGTAPPTPEAPRTEVNINEGAIRAEMHAPPVNVAPSDVHIHEGAVRADVDVEVTGDPELRAVIEANTEAVAAQAEATEELRAEVAKPKPLVRRNVETDEIGRITAITEEQI